MPTPTPDQQRVLDLPAPRVRVVRAAPGSGKTWLVAQLIRQELDGWRSPTGGVAALSFTRIGGAEIRRAIGYELAHPHFVGTIDAFVFRYIVRPFFTRCFPSFPSPRLIPGEWAPQQWGKYAKGQSATTNTGINVFGCVFIGENNGKAIVSYAKPFQRLKPLVGTELEEVRKAKLGLWKSSGCLTHSDAALWASKILDHEQHGVAVISEVVRRFPLIVVDEVQDTGYFLGKTIRTLLSNPAVRGVVVGDPDQAIYEFNGARPDLFKGFELLDAAVTQPLSSSLRCPPALANAASHLKDSGGQVGPAQGNAGRVLLVRGEDMIPEVTRIVEAAVASRPLARLKVITRQNATVDLLTGRNAKTIPKLGCPALSHINRAVSAFRRGRQVAALASVRATLECALFGHEGISEEILQQRGIDPHDWKRLAVDCLFIANGVPTTGSLHDWQTSVGATLDVRLSEFCQIRSMEFKPGKLKPKKNDGWAKPSSGHLPPVETIASTLQNVPVTTVHAVKGETHDLTIIVCPDAADEQTCLSSVWWSSQEEDREEKRIAYVAMTRTKGDLVIWMGSGAYDRLHASRPEFVTCFECMNTDGAILSFTQGAAMA